MESTNNGPHETRSERLRRLRDGLDKARRQPEEGHARLYEALGLSPVRCCGFGCTCLVARGREQL